LGKANVSGISLHQMEENRFAASALIGKLANIFADLPSKHLEGTSTFRAITGEDTINLERKYRDAGQQSVYARLVYSANHPPVAEDATEAFFQRWYVLPFGHQFRGTDEEIRSDQLLADLTTPNELSGVLNQALKVLPGVLKDGITVTESMRQGLLEFRRMSDPLSVWLDINTVYLPHDGKIFAVCQPFVDAYNSWCESKGRPGMTTTAFGLALKHLRPEVKREQRVVNGKKGVHVYAHICLKAAGAQS
jgi:putative DNA primase/helicase